MILKYKRSDHEKTKRHIYNHNNPNNPKQTPKQAKQQQDKEKEKERHRHCIEHQKVIDNLNDVFPSFQTPD